MTRWALLAGAILCEVTASLSLKGALDLPGLYVVVLIGYASSFVLLSLLLRAGMGLGVAYGIWAALGVALTSALSALLFDEMFTPLMGAGIVLVVAGVVVVEIGSQQAHRSSGAAAGYRVEA